MESSTLLLGTRKGLIVYRKNASGWEYSRDAFRGVPVSYATVDSRNGRWWACLDHGHWGCKLHYSDDEGVNWTEVAAPKYPEGEMVKEDVAATLRYLWAFTPGHDSQPGTLYAGTEPGGLFRSDDNGANFSLVESLWKHPSRKDSWFGGGRDHAGIHSILVNPKDEKHIIIGVSVAGVFETKDGGVTWQGINKGLRADYMPDPYPEYGHDPHIVVAMPGSLQYLWQQNHCGVFRSVDGGASWTDVSQKEGPAKFGFAVSVHEKDPDRAWVVPGTSDEQRVAYNTTLCVCRTKDGGKNWETLTNGLPERSYDIVFRHALDIKGDTLAFGSTTGNAFISNNQGDEWKVLSNYLPPVYSVRFAV